MSRWERRERKLRKRRDEMRVSGAGLKKILLPLIQKRAEEAEKRTKGTLPPSPAEKRGLRRPDRPRDA